MSTGNENHGDGLSETVELIGEAVGVMSGRIDDQGKFLQDVKDALVETRLAATAARSNTDPERYADLIAETVSGELGQSIAAIKTTTHELKYQSELLQKRIEDETKDKQAAERDLYTRRTEIARREAALPRKLILCTLAALLFGAVAMRLGLGTELGCNILGGGWNAVGSFCPIDPLGAP